MKKISALLLSLAMLLSLSIPTVAAANDEEYLMGNFWMFDAPMTDEILAEEAGIISTLWTVPYLTTTPALDGVINENEYGEFSGFENYISLMARSDNGPDLPATSADDFHNFRVQYDTFQGGNSFVKAYWGWDGTYLYMAFVVQNLNGFYCNPDQDWLLYAYNCLQIGVGDEYAVGKEYTELGFGINSETYEPLTYTWIGDYKSDPKADFGGKYDENTGIITYECRIDLSETVGFYADEPIAPGDTMKFAWLLSVNGQGNRTETGTATEGQEWQVGFCHGIGGPYAYKAAEYFATATFGAPEGYTPPEESDTETSAESETVTESENIAESESETEANATESTTTNETLPESADESSTETTIDTGKADGKDENKDGGCGSVIGMGVAALTVAAGAACILLRKKEN